MNDLSNKKYFFYVLLVVGIFVGLLALLAIATEQNAKLLTTQESVRFK